MEVEAEPESPQDIALLGSVRKVTLKADTKGDQMKVHILRACNVWREGDEPTVNAEYAAQLIANGLAETVAARQNGPLIEGLKP